MVLRREDIQWHVASQGTVGGAGNVPRLPISGGVCGRDAQGSFGSSSVPVTSPLSPAQRSAPRSGHDYFDVIKLFQRHSSIDNVFISPSWTQLASALSSQGAQHFCVRPWAVDNVTGVIGFPRSGWEDFPHTLPAPLLSDQPPVQQSPSTQPMTAVCISNENQRSVVIFQAFLTN